MANTLWRSGAARSSAFAAAFTLLGCTDTTTEVPDGTSSRDATIGADAVATADAPVTLLDGVAAVVVPNCAVSGCHDAVTKEHGMDLSSEPAIYESWVDRKGLDHCRNALRVRVVPGSPDGSYVMVKILGTETCALSTRMPAPPRSALSDEQIEIIRAWILAGAPRGEVEAGDPRDGAPTDASVNPDDAAPDGPLMDAIPCPEAGAPKTLRGASPSNSNQIWCTPTQPCPEGMSCVGDGCDGDWQCFAHAQSPGEHPCPTDYEAYCGCDGVTFMAPRTCPDRPYQHEGSCEDGVSCDSTALQCSGVEPTCPDGQVPSVVNGRYGACVTFGTCRCDSDAQCPHREKYRCDTGAKRCEMLAVDP